MADEIYFSTDVEADGPIPGPHSMLSFASAAYRDDGTLLATFSANLDPLDGAAGHPDTMAWWATQPEAWAACRVNPQPPSDAMPAFAAWVKDQGGRPVFVGYPVAFDFMFVHWYLMHFNGSSPFSHSALDIKTLAMALMNVSYRSSTKRNMPKHWFGRGAKHTHRALDDALEQGALFCNMLAELRSTRRP